MLLTTTTDIPNMQFSRYFGVISATSIVGGDEREVYHAALDAAADGVIAPLERLEQEARANAIDLLRFKASELQADAVIGLQIDHRTICAKRNLMMVFVAGTAVRTSAMASPSRQTVGGQGW